MKNLTFLTLCLLLVTACGQPINPESQRGANDSKVQQENISKENTNSGPNTNVCPEIYQPVCGQPPMPDCPQGRACPQVMPQPKTYSNDCKRQQAQASLIEEGECPDTTL